MSTPLDKIFEDTINNCYSDFRWLDSYTIANKGKIFNITDFIKCFQETFDEIGYTPYKEYDLRFAGQVVGRK